MFNKLDSIVGKCCSDKLCTPDSINHLRKIAISINAAGDLFVILVVSVFKRKVFLCW